MVMTRPAASTRGPVTRPLSTARDSSIATPLAAPAVPDSGDARAQGQLQVEESAQGSRGRAIGPGLREEVWRPVMAHMYVAVDEARQ